MSGRGLAHPANIAPRRCLEAGIGAHAVGCLRDTAWSSRNLRNSL
jgi:hypothetical protein